MFFIDLQKLHEDFAADLREHEHKTFPGSGGLGEAVERNPRRNSFVNSADYFGVLSRVIRQPFPAVKFRTFLDFFFASEKSSDAVSAIKDVALSQPYLKSQPWGNYRYKKPLDQLYVDGGFSGKTSAVTYRLAFSQDLAGRDYEEYVDEFESHAPEFLKQVRPPAYPFAINQDLIEPGHRVYENNCAECHGSFQATQQGWSLDYEGILVENVGTDDQRHKFFTEVVRDYYAKNGEPESNKDLEAKIEFRKGYMAPPLVGIWARAPYLHNASVANLRQLLGRPQDRFKKFGILPRPAEHKNFDQENIGWMAYDLSGQSEEKLTK